MTTTIADQITSMRSDADALLSPSGETLDLNGTRYTAEAIEVIERRCPTSSLTLDEIVGGLALCGLRDAEDLDASQIAEAMIEAGAAKALAAIAPGNSGAYAVSRYQYGASQIVARFADRRDAEDYRAISDRVHGDGSHMTIDLD